MNEPLRVFTEHLPAKALSQGASAAALELVLPFDQRQKARQRARVTAGYDVGIHLTRGTILRGGDRLRSDDGAELAIVAAREPVSTVRSRDLRELARVAYHLGNRHVPLEIGAGWVRYLQDHVLDDMVRQLGLTVLHENEPFEPEAGAYGGHSHGHAEQQPLQHGHSHSHGHSHHRHSHDHAHSHGEHAHDHDHSHEEHRTIFGGIRRGGHDQ